MGVFVNAMRGSFFAGVWCEDRSHTQSRVRLFAIANDPMQMMVDANEDKTVAFQRVCGCVGFWVNGGKS